MKRLLLHNYPAENEPDGDVLAPHHLYIGALAMWFGFQFVWPYYPEIGATLTVLGLLITADDVVSHTFGVWTPLDFAWKQIVRRVLSTRSRS